MPITTLPNPPTRQDPTNFAERADAFLAALPTFATEANQLATEVNGNANTASVAATNAQAAATAAQASAGVTLWNASTTYTLGQTVYSPSTFFTYRRRVAGQTATDPASDTTNWTQVTGTGNVNTTSTSVSMTGSTFTIGGSLGVGTVAPQIKTHIVSGSADVMRLESTTAASVLSFRTSSTTVSPYIYGTGDSFGVVTNGLQRLIISNDGNVGINGATPTLGAGYTNFHVKGSTGAILEISNGTHSVDLDMNSTGGRVGSRTNIPFSLITNNTEKVTVTSDGNVGIGDVVSSWTTSRKVIQLGGSGSNAFFACAPSSSNFASFGSNFYITQSNIALTVNSGSCTGYDQANGEHVWYSSLPTPAGQVAPLVEKMRLDLSGRLGIGTTSPTTTLDVKGSGVTVQSSDGLNVSRLTPTGSGSFSDTNYSILTNNIARVTVTNGGSVGIGTESPTSVLDINGTTMRLRSKRTISTATSTGNQGEWCYDDNFFYVCIATNTWKRMALSTW